MEAITEKQANQAHFFSMSHTTLLAIMVNWNGESFLKRNISNVLTELNSVDGELLVVDNASTDGSVNYLRNEFPNIHILQMSENMGGSGGFRAGMRVALNSPAIRYIWLLDNDTIVEKDALGPLIQVLKNDETIGAAGSQICLYNSPETVQEIGSYYTKWLAALQHHGSGKKRVPPSTPPFEVDYLAACSVLIRRKCLEEIGVFGDFFLFYDDVEWGLRAKKVGWRLLAVPASVIRHNYNMIKPIVPWREYYRKRNRLAVISSYPPVFGRRLASLIYLIYINYSILLHRFRNNYPMSHSLKFALQDAIFGKLGKRNLTCFESIDHGNINTPHARKGECVLIDIPESAGNALEALNILKTIHPNNHLLIFSAQLSHFNFLKFSEVHPLRRDINYDIVITGNGFRFSGLNKRTRAYRFINGTFFFIKYPRLEFLLDYFNRFAALTLAIVIAPVQNVKLIRRYRDGGYATFRK